jgi:outer membrane cobalamin receptor
VGALASGTNRAILLSLGWRTTLSSRTAIRQRASVIDQNFVSTRPTGQPAGRSSNRAFAYRGEFFHAMFGGTMEAGGEVRQLQGDRHIALEGPAPLPDEFGATWATRSAYVHLARTIGRRISFAGGLRVGDSTLVHGKPVAPWILGEWSFRPGWTLNASAGLSRQFPDLDAVRSVSGSSELRPEAATHIDVGIGQRAGALRWQATLFNRAERDVLRPPDVYPRLADGVAFWPTAPASPLNALRGGSRGVELLVAREGTGRLSGWVSYAYGRTRQTDALDHETFWGDFDQRHAFNATGVYRVSDVTSVGIMFRAGSNIPIPGYLTARNGALFIGERRNEVRLSHYARLDARAQRALDFSKGRITVFAEVLNVLNRQNLGPADGLVQPLTGEATGFSRTLIPRRVSAGIQLDVGPNRARQRR